MEWVLEASVLPDILSFADAAALCGLVVAGKRSRELVASYLPDIAKERRIRRIIGAEEDEERKEGEENCGALLAVLSRRERAEVWETFEDESWRCRWVFGPPPSSGTNPWADLEETRPQAVYDFLGVDENCLRLRGGGEANFNGLRQKLGRPTRPRRVSFRYRVKQKSSRRGFCNVFFSKNAEAFRESAVFYAGGPEVFSFLLPLGRAGRPELWLPSSPSPGTPSDAISQFGPNSDDQQWHTIDAHFDWIDADENGDSPRESILVYSLYHDGNEASNGFAPIHTDCDALRYVYIFNWISNAPSREDQHRGLASEDDQQNDDVPEAQIADLIVEEQGITDQQPRRESLRQLRLFFSGDSLHSSLNNYIYMNQNDDDDDDDDDDDSAGG